MSETNGAPSTPSGHHFLEIGGKLYDFHLTSWKVHQAEQLLGCGVLEWRGGGVTYNLTLGYAMLEGQHGVDSMRSVSELFDAGPMDDIDMAITGAVLDFFQQFPSLSRQLEPIRALLAQRKNPGKAAQNPKRKQKVAAK